MNRNNSHLRIEKAAMRTGSLKPFVEITSPQREFSERTVLVVDDEMEVRELICRLLEKNGIRYVAASSASEARDYFRKHYFDLMLCDVMMPEESGLEFVRTILAEKEDLAVIMLTGMEEPAVAETAFDLGVYGYVVKPFKPGELLITISSAFRRNEAEKERRKHWQVLEDTVAERTRELQESVAKIKQTMTSVIQAMAMAIESRDPYTAGHQRRVSALARSIAGQMGLSPEQMEGVEMAGLIHDIGKIAVPVEILSKPGELTAVEFEIIKAHPEVGYAILKDIDFPWPLALMVLQHHERIDGSGYPRGLSGNDILLEAQILGVADVVEAMASHRPYRAALGLDTALEEISKHQGELYDSEVVAACRSTLRNGNCELEEHSLVQ